MSITIGDRLTIESNDFTESDDGHYLAINNGKHAVAAVVVVRYDEETEDDRNLLAFATLLTSAEELADALEYLTDLYDASGLPAGSKARRNAEAVLKKISRRGSQT